MVGVTLTQIKLVIENPSCQVHSKQSVVHLWYCSKVLDFALENGERPIICLRLGCMVSDKIVVSDTTQSPHT